MSIKYNGGYIPAVGADGTTLVANSASATGVAWAGPSVAAGKNILINGGMDIWQRGTTSSLYSTYATADRWYIGGGGSITTNQDTDVPSGIPVQYSLNWTTTAGSSYGQFYQLVEQATVKTLRGQTVTASAWFKTAGTAYANNLIFRFDYNTTSDTIGTGTWSNIAGTDVPFAGSSATSWVKKTSTFVVPSNAVGLRVSLIPDTVQSSGVIAKMTAAQLEIGSVATAFSRAGGTLQGELAACQRYYQTINTTSDILGIGSAYSSTNAYIFRPFPVTMRATPSINFSASNIIAVYIAGAGYNSSAIVIDSATINGFNTKITSSGMTSGYAGHAVLQNSPVITISAEL